MKKKLEECSQKKSKLLEEWKMYSTTLKSIGCEVPETPLGLYELEKKIDELRTECLNRLGEEGLKVLKFLKGEENFPEEISKEGIMKTLLILRPLISKSLKEGA